MAKNKTQPATPPEMSETDKIIRATLTALSEKGFSIALFTDGTIGVNMATSDYTIKVTKKKDRIM